MINNSLIKSPYKNKQTKRYFVTLVFLFLLAPITWVAALIVNPTFEEVSDFSFHTRILSVTENKEVMRVRVKNESEQTITGGFRLVVLDPTLPVKNAAGVTEQGEPYFLFKKGEILTVLPGSSIRTRISNELLEDDDMADDDMADDDMADDEDEPSAYDFRLERRITPEFNNQPVANAGPDQFRLKGDLVYLDGSQSYDLDGERLVYSWVLEKKPAASVTTLVNVNSVNPYFNLDVKGRYVFALYVNDGIENSLYDRVRIKTRNIRPVAQAGANQLVVPGDIAQLDGSASTDANGDSLRYTWLLEKSPEGSVAVLENADSVQPKLNIDSSGQYIVRLKVNDGKRNSLPDRVVITDGILQPIADAGADQATIANTIIQLDASASYALDAQPLTYNWSIVTAPDNSVSSLNDKQALKPTLFIDQPGDYIIQLIVNDGVGDSLADQVIVSTNNVRPVADVGDAQNVLTESLVQLNAANSFDANADILSYQWSILHRPETSVTTLSNISNMLTDFIADVSGQYVVQLVANDGQLDSSADTVLITADTQVNQPPVIQSSPILTAQTDTLYSYGVTATDDDGDTLTYTLTQSPTGMIIGSVSGLITWTPGVSGSYPVTVQVSDDQGGEDTQQFTVIVEQLNEAPIIQSVPVLIALTDTLYSYNVIASDVNGDALTYTLTQSPAGMIIDPTSGLITWTPNVSSSFSVAVKVSDGRGGEAIQQFVVIVELLNQAPVIQSVPVITAQTDVAYSYDVFATDANGDSLTYALAQSPAGMSINTVSGLISWIPTATGSNPVTVQVSDGRGGVDEQLFVITVTQSNRDPVVTSTPITQAIIDQPYTYQVVANDADADVLIYRLLASPLGMNINASTGLISWQAVNFETAAVNIEVDDTNGGITTQQYTVSSNYPADNLPPVFTPLTDQVVPIGSTLSLQFNAQDPEGKVISYSVLPLPMPVNATLNAQTGKLLFEPQAAQGGEYNLLISASDSRFTTVQNLKITVPSIDLTAPTNFHGRVIDANSASQGVDQPIVGATISFLNTGVSTVTDAQGVFTLNNLPPTAEVFSINSSTANLAPGGASYASFNESLTLIEHSNNIRERPFYIPRNNMASMTQVDPNQTTMVENTELGVMLEIPPNTAVNADGTPFIGQISITEVPDGLSPASMPENFNPALLVTIQPAGVRFTTPVPITFPNVDNLPPGTEFSIMSVNPDTGVFEPVGTARVSADGKRIETVSGGIREADWHFPSVQAIADILFGNGDNEGTNEKCTGSTTCLKDGRMSQTVSLPEYRSLEADRAVSLTYQTSRAGEVAQALQNLGSTRFGNRPRIRIKITYKLVQALVGRQLAGPPPTPDYTKITTTIAGIEGVETFLGIPPLSQDNVFTGVALETAGLDTGMYTAKTTVVAKVGFSISGVTNSTETMIINESGSAFGAGWMIEDVDRLHFHATTGTALLVSADGRYKVYKFDKTSQLYTTPKGDFSTLVKNADNSYTLTDQFGNQSFFNSRGLQTERQDLNGNSTVYAYNTDNELISVTDPVGKQTLFNYSNGRVTSITDPANRITQFEHDGLGNLTRIIYPDDSEMKYEYAGHLLTKKTDERNNVTEYHYDEEGFNTHVTLPDNSQRGVRSSLSKGFATSSDINNPLDSFFDATSGTYFNARGNVSEFELDDRSFVTKQVDSLGRITLYERDANSRPLKITRPNGSVLTKTFDTLGNTTLEREEFNGAQYQFTYDSHSLITKITNPNNHSVIVTRDASGNPIEIVNELGHITTIDFDTSGLPIRIVTPNNLEIIRIYNTDGLLETQIETPPAGSLDNVRTSHYQYFANGLLKQVDTADGRTYTYTYDQRSRLLSITDNFGQKQNAQYDSYGNIISVDTINADGSDALHVEYNYDSRNRITEMRLPHQQVDAITRLILDGEDNVTELIDPKGSQRKMHYDKVDRLDENTHRLNGLSLYSYDLNDQITRVISPNGATTDYSYDLLGRRLSETSPDRGTLQYQYDLADNLIQQIDARGIVTNYTYDALERLSSKIFPSSPVENVTLLYDVCTLGTGRLCDITDETGVSTYQYDAWGNITQLQKTELGKTYATAYQYDEGNNISQMIYPSGRIISITRDGVRRLQSIQTSLNQNGVTTNKTLMANSLYRADDQLTQSSYGNGLTESYSYDLQGRLTGQNTNNGAGIIDQRVYDYDINSNLISRAGSAQSSNYNYDLLDRLTQDDPSSTQNLAARQSTLQYDQNHNRQRKTSYLPDLANAQSTQTKAYSYNSLSNQLLAEETLSENLPLTTNNENEQLQYNVANRLSSRSVTDGVGVLIKATDYLYNAQGQRTRKISHQTNGTSVTTVYHYNLEGQLISETNELGANIRDYVWHSLSPVAQIEHDQQAANDDIYYLHTDHLFTPRFATDENKQIIWRWEGEAFGETVAEKDVDGDGLAAMINLRFPGQYYDSESNTHYNYFRDYDPSIGRYIESDPIGLFAGVNTFGYVGGNPVGNIDPLGLTGFGDVWRWMNNIDKASDVNDALTKDNPTPDNLSPDEGRELIDNITDTISPIPFFNPFEINDGSLIDKALKALDPNARKKRIDELVEGKCPPK